VVTDSKLPGEPKDPDGSHLVTLYDAFASADERAAFRAELRAGLGWGEAKQRLVAQIQGQVGPMRATYDELMAHPERIEEVLQAGARRARAVAQPFLAELRRAVGLRPMLAAPARPAAASAPAAEARAALPAFKQYRESDGRFYFKLAAANGTLLLQSQGLADAREAGAWVKRLKSEGEAALDGAPVALADGVPRESVAAALAALRAAEA